MRDEGDLLLGIEARGGEHRRHPIRRGRDHGEAVGPALLVAELDRVDVLDAISLGCQLDRHPRLLLSIAALSIAAWSTFIECRFSPPRDPRPGARAARAKAPAAA